jgi:hypothetical protein
MQAQNPLDPYVGIWARVEGFDPAKLGSLVRDSVLLGNSDRLRFFADGGPIPAGWAGNVLVDGMYAGSWKLDQGNVSVSLQTEVTSRQRREVTEEAEWLQNAITD